jgi:AcrR family transcriptional regulator
MRRAIREDQKEARRQALLDVAWSLFQQRPYEAVNMFDVARGAGLAKGTVYLYFKTKEELFLVVLEQQFQQWFDAVDVQLHTLPVNSAVTELVNIIESSLVLRPALVRLFAITHIFLEHNADFATILHFKAGLLERLAHTGALIEARFPAFEPGAGAQFLLRAYALVIGIQSLADPAPTVRQVIAASPALRVFEVDFSSEFTATLSALLKGMVE